MWPYTPGFQRIRQVVPGLGIAGIRVRDECGEAVTLLYITLVLIRRYAFVSHYHHHKTHRLIDHERRQTSAIWMDQGI